MRSFLWKWMQASVESKEFAAMHPAFLSDVDFYYQEIESLLEAVWWISEQGGNKGRK
jgi:hypothetical protein